VNLAVVFKAHERYNPRELALRAATEFFTNADNARRCGTGNRASPAGRTAPVGEKAFHLETGMADIAELKAQPRDKTGSAAARTIRKDGGVPAIVYGGRSGPEQVTLNYKEVWKQVETGQFLSTVYMLDVDGKKTRVLPKDVQFDPVRDFVEHIDFLRLAKDAVVEVEVPVHVINEDDAPGLKRGGVLNFVRHAIEVSCPADAIPDSIDVDVAGRDIGDSVHISEITLPEKVTPTITDRDFTILTIVGAAAAEPEDESEGEAEAEGEGEADTEADAETEES